MIGRQNHALPSLSPVSMSLAGRLFHTYLTDATPIAKIHVEVRVATSLPLESSVQTSCVETLDYSGYEHSHNYGCIATPLQLLSSSTECVVRQQNCPERIISDSQNEAVNRVIITSDQSIKT
jgi:hypothetical protein